VPDIIIIELLDAKGVVADSWVASTAEQAEEVLRREGGRLIAHDNDRFGGDGGFQGGSLRWRYRTEDDDGARSSPPGVDVALVELRTALADAAKAANEASNDTEIEALGNALDAALTRWPEIGHRWRALVEPPE
jgi:hypothetical protein